jgi:pimeloyl-ACP methyl ester carboxylesterase
MPASCPSIGVVFVANGSGDLLTASNNLRQVVEETATPIQIETFDWSHGYLRFLTDHLDHPNHLAQGRLLAAEVLEYRRAYPDRRINLLGYSTGSAVVLAAAELLPRGSIDGIVLLAPAVCADYDLRPALSAARDGIDVFCSKDDRIILGLGMKIVGTAEGCCREAAGQCGFNPVIVCPGDSALYAKLRQHAWSPAVEWTGNTGGHYGSNQPDFLRVYVLPFLVQTPTRSAARTECRVPAR